MALCRGWELRPICNHAVLSDGMSCDDCWNQKHVAATHDLVDDGVRCERKTCSRCHRAVIIMPGYIYGSALTEVCDAKAPV